MISLPICFDNYEELLRELVVSTNFSISTVFTHAEITTVQYLYILI
jgi:hypothetical protein